MIHSVIRLATGCGNWAGWTLLLALVSSCAPPNAPLPTTGHPGSGSLAAPTETALVQLESAPLWREVPATVHSLDHISVAAEVDGRLLAIFAETGDWVREGQTLATLDASVLQAERDAVAAALDLAIAEQDRVQRLVEARVASQRELDEVRSIYKRTLANFQVSETALKRTEVLSPVNGVVEARLIGPGDLAFPGKPIYRLYDPKRLVLEAQIPMDDVASAKLGSRLYWSLGRHESSSEVTEVAPSSDPRSRTQRVRLALDQEDPEFLATLAPGGFGIVRYSIGARPFLWVPAVAVHRIGQLEIVLVETQDGIWARRSVRSGRKIEGKVEILSGLTAGEKVGWSHE
jgi:RND family efflux transporter MFP subunit